MNHCSLLTLIAPLSLLLLFGCEKNMQQQVASQVELNHFEKNCKKLPADICALSEEDARIVANLFAGNNLLTKSCHEKRIKEVVPVYGEDQHILMYAVNYTDGYILVSATTNYYPILAVVEHGSFAILPDSGQECIIDELKTAVSLSNENPVQDAYHAWREYISSPTFETTETKVGSDYYTLLNNYLGGWLENGGAVYYLKSKPEGLPEEIYERFCENAHEDTPSDYPYMDCAIITEKHVYSTTTYGPFLQTSWDQDGNGNGGGMDYNFYVPNNRALGCVTVAVGQIMRYFEYPLTYNWSIMPNNTSNAELSSFLAALRTDLCVDDDGGTYDSNAKNTFRNYGYSSSLNDHSATNVCASLHQKRPVYLSGDDLNHDVGHAWVCDGYYSTIGYYDYRLYIPRVINGVLYDFIEWDAERLHDYFGPILFHMNWGWGGSHDGYYLDNSIKINRPTSSRNYSSNRKDILISVPNRN